MTLVESLLVVLAIGFALTTTIVFYRKNSPLYLHFTFVIGLVYLTGGIVLYQKAIQNQMRFLSILLLVIGVLQMSGYVWTRFKMWELFDP